MQFRSTSCGGGKGRRAPVGEIEQRIGRTDERGGLVADEVAVDDDEADAALARVRRADGTSIVAGAR